VRKWEAMKDLCWRCSCSGLLSAESSFQKLAGFIYSSRVEEMVLDRSLLAFLRREHLCRCLGAISLGGSAPLEVILHLANEWTMEAES
jgi:hypothetical protein